MELQVSLEKLDAFATTFWNAINGATVVLFHGEMGAGKTTLIAALCRAKGVQDVVSSPTFSIINEYAYPEHGVLKKLYHIDLYRLQSEAEVVQAGVEDCLDSGAVCFIEWPEKAPGLFDTSAVRLFIEPVSSTERRIKIITEKEFRNGRSPERL